MKTLILDWIKCNYDGAFTMKPQNQDVVASLETIQEISFWLTLKIAIYIPPSMSS